MSFFKKLIGGVTNVIGSVTGANAAASAAKKAGGIQADAAQSGIDQIRELLSPFIGAGTQALGSQQALLGLSGQGAQQAAIQALQQSPFFTAQLQRGENSILQNASATGGLRGGNTQAALAQFAPQLLGQAYQQQLQGLGGLSGQGLSAAGSAGSQIAELLGQQGAARAGATLAQGQKQGQVFGSALQLGGLALGGLGGGRTRQSARRRCGQLARWRRRRFPWRRRPRIGRHRRRLHQQSDRQHRRAFLMQPIDYSQGFQPVNIADNIGAGFNVGAGIRQELQRRQDEAVARQKAEQDQLKAIQRQAAYERDLYDTFNDPSPQRLAKLQITYPERVKEFQTGFDTMDKARVDNERAFVGKLYSAMRTNPQVAEKLLTDRVTALTNSGEDTSEEQTALDLLKSNPKQALGYIGSLAAFTLPKDQIEALNKLDENTRAQELQPSKVAESKATAEIKTAEAAAAPAKYAFDVAKVQEEIRASKENTRIRALEASLKREDNDLKRGELQVKLTEARRAFDEKVAGKEAELNSALASTDNFLNTADRTLKVFDENPGAVRSATGPIQGRLPSLGQDTVDFEGLVENLKSQAFLAQIPNIKGMGALSNAEGEKLQNALQNFDLKQSPERLKTNLQEAARLITKARSNIEKRYGAAPSAPDVGTVGDSGGPSIEDLLRKYGGGQ